MTGLKGSTRNAAQRSTQSPRAYPFTSLVGQEEMRLALLLCVVEPAIGGVLITGHRGTGKSTAVRALADLLPPLTRSARCPFNCDPDQTDELCDSCRDALDASGKLKRERANVPVVDLPLNATEDRVCGAINLERALREGLRAFEPGLLARAHRGFLYIDEVNLLEDHLVDLLLDVSATGRNRVEREGVSAEHAARFCLVGSSNPEEGELRPQLLDRFGFCAEVRTPDNAQERAEVVMRREAFDRDRESFCEAASAGQTALRRKLVRARRNVSHVEVPRELVRSIAELCARLGVDGHRGELTIARASRALAAFEGRKIATMNDARRVASLALRHRMHRDPFEQSGGGGQIEKVSGEIFDDTESNRDEQRGGARSESKERAASSVDETGERGGKVDSQVPTERDARAPSKQNSYEEQRNASPEGIGGASAATLSLPPIDSTAHIREAKEAKKSNAQKRMSPAAHGRARSSASSVERGRFFGAVSDVRASRALAFDATLRAAATRRTRTNFEDNEARSDASTDQTQYMTRAAHGPGDARASQMSNDELVASEDLRYKLFSRKAGTLYIFAIDASGSMALNRIGQAKGALARLLRRSYVRRDRVALVTFRESRGQILLRPTRSHALARRLLDSLLVGGATPLADGLRCAHEIAERARREGTDRIALLVFTDGRANVSVAKSNDEGRASLRLKIEREVELVGDSLRRTGVESVVIDTRTRFTGDAEGKRLARALGGSYTRLPLTEQGV
ncbi:MAG: magnesium chelatase subunit [Acidobacteriota bacterium]|nr:magnesium chelatase subunit [Acidobacteriota bacterium]